MTSGKWKALIRTSLSNYNRRKEMTATEWLQLDDETLGLELAKALVPGPWSEDHQWKKSPDERWEFYCSVCDTHVDVPDVWGIPCNLPDPINIEDLNVAMKIFRDTYGSYGAARNAMLSIWKSLDDTFDFEGWLMFEVLPKHYLIAAVLSVEGRK